jgi:membrane protease YdiL (CAAX protease family)
VLGVAYVLSKSLWWLMLAHILLNLNSWALHWRSQRDLAAQPA